MKKMILGVLLGFSLHGIAQTPVSADPAINNFDVLNTSNISIPANSITNGQVIKLKVLLENTSQTTDIPSGTCVVSIGLGTKMVVNPGFNLSTAPLSAIFDWQVFNVGGQFVIYGSIKAGAVIPADFSDYAIFELLATATGSSTFQGNFFISNSNPLYTLSDEHPENNTTSTQYTVSAGSAVLMFRLKMFLQGATLGSSPSSMRDNLRNSPYTSLRYIPNTDPYTNDAAYNTGFVAVGDGLNPAYQTVVSPATMFVNGANNAVDWVFIELRDKTTPSIVRGTRSAMLLQDGTVLDVDGSNCIKFPSLALDAYYVAIRHRNHLGAMTATALPSTKFTCSELVDFTSMTNADLWNNPSYDGLEMAILPTSNIRALWAGNATGHNPPLPELNKVKYQGSNSDRTVIQLDVINFPGNPTGILNYDLAYGYFKGDIDMDSKVKYQGAGSDRSLLQSLVFGYLLNTTLNLNYDLFLEQLPY
ncbi:MAG: hypothetical protein V4722_00015 [Bacteroidota bacterium]